MLRGGASAAQAALAVERGRGRRRGARGRRLRRLCRGGYRAHAGEGCGGGGPRVRVAREEVADEGDGVCGDVRPDGGGEGGGCAGVAQEGEDARGVWWGGRRGGFGGKGCRLEGHGEGEEGVEEDADGPHVGVERAVREREGEGRGEVEERADLLRRDEGRRGRAVEEEVEVD